MRTNTFIRVSLRRPAATPLMLIVLLLASPAVASGATWQVGPEGPMGLEVVRDGTKAMFVTTSAWGKDWKWFEYPGPTSGNPRGDRVLKQTASIPGTGARLNLDYHVRQASPTSVEMYYGLLASDAAEMVGLACTLRPPPDTQITATLPDTDAETPVTAAENGKFGETVRRVTIRPAGASAAAGGTAGDAFTIDIAPARRAEWVNGELRIWLIKDTVPAKTPVNTTLTIGFPAPAKFFARDADAKLASRGADWFPYPVAMGGTPVDLSFLNRDAAGKFVPAGSHGFLQVKGDDFAFADGTPARFWGVNLTAAAALAPTQRAQQLADRLARLGCNVVRLHHLDSDWSPNIIDREHPDGTTQHLDDADMRRLDRLVFELKSRGIYVIMDPWVGRSYRPGDKVVGSDKFREGNHGLHGMVFFDPRMRELHKLFLRQFWTHVNEFTGLAYKDDPAIITTEVVNEALLDLKPGGADMHEHYRTQLVALYNKWCADNGETPSPGEDVIKLNYPEQHQRFFQHVMRSFYADVRKFLKEDVGLKIPVNDSNWFRWPWEIASQDGGDFMDVHHYYHGTHIGPSSDLGGLWVAHAPVGRDFPFARISAMALPGKPVISSECGDSPPQTYRSSYYVGLAAVASLQGYDALTPYAYSQGAEPKGVLGAYEMESDPATVASLAAGALIYRRGDVAPAKGLAVMCLPESERYAMHWENHYANAFENTPQFRALSEVHRLAVVFDDAPPPGTNPTVTMTPEQARSYAHPNTELRSDTGQLWRDWSIGVGTIDTPRTQAAYGMLGESKKTWTTADASFDVSTPFATVVLSSLTDDPVRASGRLLLTAVARAEDANQTYNLSRTRLASQGQPPVLAEPVVGKVTFATSAKSLTARPLMPNGHPGPAIPLTVRDGKATLDLQAAHKTLFYEISAAP